MASLGIVEITLVMHQHPETGDGIKTHPGMRVYRVDHVRGDAKPFITSTKVGSSRTEHEGVDLRWHSLNGDPTQGEWYLGKVRLTEWYATPQAAIQAHLEKIAAELAFDAASKY